MKVNRCDRQIKVFKGFFRKYTTNSDRIRKQLHMPTRPPRVFAPRAYTHQSGAHIRYAEPIERQSMSSKPIDVDLADEPSYWEKPPRKKRVMPRRALLNHGLAVLGSGFLGLLGVHSALDDRDVPRMDVSDYMSDYRPRQLARIAELSREVLVACDSLQKYDEHLGDLYLSLESFDQLWSDMQGPRVDCSALLHMGPRADTESTSTSKERYALATVVIASAVALVMYDWFHGRSLEGSDTNAGSTFDRRSFAKGFAGMVAGMGIYIQTSNAERDESHYEDLIRKEIKAAISWNSKMMPYTGEYFSGMIDTLTNCIFRVRALYEEVESGSDLLQDAQRALEVLTEYHDLIGRTFGRYLSGGWYSDLFDTFATDELVRTVRKLNERMRQDRRNELNVFYYAGGGLLFAVAALEIFEWRMRLKTRSSDASGE